MSEEERDMTAAIGEGASPDFGTRTGDAVPLQSDDWSDARWSYLYKSDTEYAAREVPETVAEAAVRARTGPLGEVAPGMMKAPVWTWEVPLYFWTGGIASGSAFVALACDLAGDHRSARIARLVALGALAPPRRCWSWTSAAPSASTTCSASSRPARRCRWGHGR